MSLNTAIGVLAGVAVVAVIVMAGGMALWQSRARATHAKKQEKKSPSRRVSPGSSIPEIDLHSSIAVDNAMYRH